MRLFLFNLIAYFGYNITKLNVFNTFRAKISLFGL